MSKKITIKEQDVEEPAEETREEIVEQLNAPAPSSPEPVSYTHLTLPTICSV